jgi:hypothetical protein
MVSRLVPVSARNRQQAEAEYSLGAGLPPRTGGGLKQKVHAWCATAARLSQKPVPFCARHKEGERKGREMAFGSRALLSVRGSSVESEATRHRAELGVGKPVAPLRRCKYSSMSDSGRHFPLLPARGAHATDFDRPVGSSSTAPSGSTARCV